MSANTKIEWCHHTFNPWIGCAHVSPGCENCYAEVNTFARRQRAGGIELWGPKSERHVTSEANWRQPFKWDRDAAAAGERRRVFCASLSDVFEDRADLIAPRSWLWRLIEDTPNLDWLLLTKRPQNALGMLPWGPNDGAWLRAPLPNVWLGTTVEDQRRANERIPHLLRTPAAVRFLSCEPLLGPVDLTHARCSPPSEESIDWVIVGGESGHGARPFDLTWAQSIVEQCRGAGVAVFVKQLGARPEHPMAYDFKSDTLRLKLRDRKGGDMDEWPADLRVREYPVVAL